MGKRNVKRRQRAGEFNTAHYQAEEDKVRALFPGTSWSPDEKEPMRDQRFIKNVKPRSDGPVSYTHLTLPTTPYV